jgi:hypothetical protein
VSGHTAVIIEGVWGRGKEGHGGPSRYYTAGRREFSNTLLEELNPQPYWGFDDLEHKAGTKLLNCFYIQADVKQEGGREYYWYRKALMLQKFSFEGFLQALEQAFMLVDFDARTGHNHGTKFRLRQNHLPALYEHHIPSNLVVNGSSHMVRAAPPPICR